MITTFEAPIAVESKCAELFASLDMPAAVEERWCYGMLADDPTFGEFVTQAVKDCGLEHPNTAIRLYAHTVEPGQQQEIGATGLHRDPKQFLIASWRGPRYLVGDVDIEAAIERGFIPGSVLLEEDPTKRDDAIRFAVEALSEEALTHPKKGLGLDLSTAPANTLLDMNGSSHCTPINDTRESIDRAIAIFNPPVAPVTSARV